MRALAVIMACAALIIAVSVYLAHVTSGVSSAAADPPQSWRFETEYFDSVFVHLHAARILMDYIELRPGHDVDDRQFRKILALAQHAQASARVGIPPGWEGIASDFASRAGDLVGAVPVLKQIRAKCDLNPMLDDRPYTDELTCPEGMPTIVERHGTTSETWSATAGYVEIIEGRSNTYASAWSEAMRRDPQLNSDQHMRDVQAASVQQLEGVVDWNDFHQRMGI